MTIQANQARFNRAETALHDYKDMDDHVSALVDLLSDLHHWAQVMGVDIQDAMKTAQYHFEVEQSETEE